MRKSIFLPHLYDAKSLETNRFGKCTIVKVLNGKIRNTYNVDLLRKELIGKMLLKKRMKEVVSMRRNCERKT